MATHSTRRQLPPKQHSGHTESIEPNLDAGSTASFFVNEFPCSVAKRAGSRRRIGGSERLAEEAAKR